MLGKLSSKALATRVFILLAIVLLFNVVGLIGKMLVGDSFNRALSFWTIYNQTHQVVWIIVVALLIWHGCDVLYRILLACDIMRQHKL